MSSEVTSSSLFLPSLTDCFKGDVYLLVKLLLPAAGKKRVYNLQSKQIVKVLSLVFDSSLEAMVEDLNKVLHPHILTPSHPLSFSPYPPLLCVRVM